MSDNKRRENGRVEIFCKFIIRNGKRIFPKNGRCFHFYL